MINQYGVVSRPVATAMAIGAQKSTILILLLLLQEMQGLPEVI